LSEERDVVIETPFWEIGPLLFIHCAISSLAMLLLEWCEILGGKQVGAAPESAREPGEVLGGSVFAGGEPFMGRRRLGPTGRAPTQGTFFRLAV